MATNPTVTIYFVWGQASADPRQYGQQRTLLLPFLQNNDPLRIAVDIPLKHEYVYNAEEIIQAQLKSDKEPRPILTPAGLFYADESLTGAYLAGDRKQTDEALPDEEDDEIFNSKDWDKQIDFNENEDEELEDIVFNFSEEE
jgi:hypothetical protein